MASDPQLPASLAAEIADLKRRLDNLERSPKLPNSSTRGGKFAFLDAGGGPRWSMGNVELAADGSISEQSAYGVFGYGDEGALAFILKQGARGLAYPHINVPFYKTTGDAVTSGSFVSLWETTIDHPAHEVLWMELAVITDAGTTGEVRLREGFSGGNCSEPGRSATTGLTVGWLLV
jgi:hypothetical protein